MIKKDNLSLFNSELDTDKLLDFQDVDTVITEKKHDARTEKNVAIEPSLSIDVDDIISVKKNDDKKTENISIKNFKNDKYNVKQLRQKNVGIYYKVAAVVSGIWLLASIYLFVPSSILSFDSLNILQMFGVVGSILFPIFSCWFIAYCMDRISVSRCEQELLYPFLKHLLSADENTLQNISDMVKVNTKSELQQITRQAQDVLKVYSNAIKIESNDAVQSLKNQLELMTSTTIKVANDSNNVGRQIAVQTRDLNGLLESFSIKTKDVLNQEDLISKMYVRLNDLSKKISVDLKSVQSLTEELNGKSDIIDRAGDKSVEAIAKISGSIDGNINKFINVITTINDSAKKSDEFIKNSVKGIDGAIENMNQLTDKTRQISEYTQGMESILEKRSADLSEVANVVSTQMRLGESSLKNQSKILSDTAEMLLIKVDDVSKKISISVGNVLSLSDKVSSAMNGTHKNVMGNAKEIFEAMKSNVITTDNSFEKFQNMSENISARMNDVNGTIDKSVAEMKQNFASLTMLMEKLKAFTSLDFNTLLKNRNSELESILNNMTERFEKLAANNSAKVIERSIENRAVVVEDSDKKISVSLSETVNETGIIFEKLAAISVDITRVFAGDVQSELWEKYYNGNRTVFVKYLAKALSSNQKDNIKKMYQNNGEFREYVDKFLKEFDSIILKSMLSEKGKLLTHIITDSTVGKVYILLKETLKA